MGRPHITSIITIQNNVLSLVKLAWTELTQKLSKAALAVLGDEAPLWPTPGGDLAAGTWQRQWLWSKAAGIAGGTTEVQRTIVAERLLGLPRTPLVHEA